MCLKYKHSWYFYCINLRVGFNGMFMLWSFFTFQDNTQRNSLKAYKKELVAIAIGTLSLLIFDLCER
jgi:putative flippase GtrA